MPELIGVPEFLTETWEDYNSPTTSDFVSRMSKCKQTVTSLEESLDYDRVSLTKMKKSFKALHSSGNNQVNNESYLAENLERMGHSTKSQDIDPTLGEAFFKFSVVMRELSSLMKNLMQSLSNILMFPLDSLLKGDLKGVKGDTKKPFDKAWKEYENKFNKIEKEKKQLAKEAGLFKTEVTGPEIAEEMEKERRIFQLQMCEYLIKVNEIKTKKGTDLLQNLVKFYQAQNNYFQDGLKTIEHFRCYIEDLVLELTRIRQQQDQEKWQLIELRDALKSSMTSYTPVTVLTKDTEHNKHSIRHQSLHGHHPPAHPHHRLSTASSTTSGYSLHQLQGNKAHGSVKRGYLLKKSDGKMRKVWQRRRCIIENGCLSISHSDETKDPVRLNLLTCQVKLMPDDVSKKCFDLISSSKNRTYHFQAEDTLTMEEWISVLNNAKEEVLLKAFGETSGQATSRINQSIKELTSSIIQEVRRLPGNSCCCDCGAPEPEWLSVNLGVLICLECCGVHREMGVHISRTQSIVIDHLGTSQLLLARAVGNQVFNEIMEATLDPKYKPIPTSEMDEKKSFIRAKYEKKRYAIVTCTNIDDRRQDLKQAIVTQDMSALLQVYAEGIDFLEPLPELDNEENALHLSILQEDGNSLYLVDFVLQNSNNQKLGRLTRDGRSALHLCAIHNKRECMKLLLRVQPDLVNVEDATGLTSLEVAKERGHDLCVELLNHAIAGKTEHFENVNVDWGLFQDDHFFDNVDYSDDDLDNNHTSEQKARSRPNSMVLTADSTLPLPNRRERNHTTDCNFYHATLPTKHKVGQMLTTTQSLDSRVGGALSLSQPSIVLQQQQQQQQQGGSQSSMGPPPTTSTQSNTLRRKAPAPPPPTYIVGGHNRNTSDPGLHGQLTHSRMTVDSAMPPPLPAKTGMKMAGAKLVLPTLPPPLEFRGADHPGGKPVPAPRVPRLGNHGNLSNTSSVSRETQSDTASVCSSGPESSIRTTSEDQYNGRTPSSERLDSTDSSSVERLDSASTTIHNPHSRRKQPGERRYRSKYNCQADNEDELSFEQGEVIIVVKEEEEEWWEGYIEAQPHRRGMFPTTFVTLIPEH